ncbi:uncharacterized protein LOC131650046 [Vicia villosa]|uniref:uncharacterized protein LOC131650046 n=1 Tax=Vicia villosa TaxID=3911 RepID=UPI00273A8A83|nr:uncharacterized protein LOC131650046 [Vicia villosa]
MFKAEKKHSIWWKDMMMAGVHKTNNSDCFAGNITFGLGAGNSIPFWFGRWLGGTAFRLLFPLVFSLSTKKLGFVNEMGSLEGQCWSWDLHLQAEGLLENPLAVQEALELLDILGGIKPLEDGVDTSKWWPNADGVFSVKSCATFLRERYLERPVEANCAAAINLFWGTDVPSKIKIFGWRLMLNRLPVREQLAKRNVIHRDEDKICVFCSAESEDMEHLFFKCPFSKKIWKNICWWLDVQMEGELVGANHLERFVQSLKGKLKRKKRCLIWLTTVWSIWNSRNNFMFNNANFVLDEVTVNIKLVSWIWLSIGAKSGNFVPLFYWFQAPLDVLSS